jgi:hypothetical protein
VAIIVINNYPAEIGTSSNQAGTADKTLGTALKMAGTALKIIGTVFFSHQTQKNRI